MSGPADRPRAWRPRTPPLPDDLTPLVKPDDPADLARGLGELLANAELRAELGLKGQSVVRERFTAEAMARQTAEVYRKYLP